MIRAIYKDGQVRLMDPAPSSWADGQELTVEASATTLTASELDEWERELDQLASRIPPEEHARFLQVMDEIEAESKRSVRREWGLE